MKWHYPLIFPMLLALLLALPDPAVAAAEFPYELDRSFSGDGYDLNADAELARKVAHDGDVAIVAASKDNGDGTIQVRLYRYDEHGNRLPWTATGDVARVLASSNRVTAIKDLVVSPATGDLLLLLDRQNSAQDTRIGTTLIRIPLSGANGGTLLAVQPGGQLQQRFLGGQLALAGTTLFMLYSPIDPDAPYVRESIGRDEFHVARFTVSGGSWSLSSSWGANGVRGYNYTHSNCYVAAPPPQPPVFYYRCGLAATRMVYNANDSNKLWIAGSNRGENVTWLDDDGVFLFRVNAATGDPDTTFGNAGWVSRRLASAAVQEHAIGLIVRESRIQVSNNPPTFKTYDEDAYLLNALERPCGNGFLIYRYNNDGSYSNSPTIDNGRSYTHGGGSSGTSCDSIRAHAMAFIPTSGPELLGTTSGLLATVSQGSTNSAILQTLDADALHRNADQGLQVIFQGQGLPFPLSYDFNAAAWHSAQQRLLVAGQRKGALSLDQSMLVARLREPALLSDGFEGN